MKKTGIFLLAALFVCASAVASFSGMNPAAPAESKAAAPTVSKAATPAENKVASPEAKAESVKSVSGKVIAVDAQAQTVTVKSKQAEVIVSLNNTTAIMANKEKKTLADIKAGDMLRVRYAEVDGKNVAARVKIMKVAASVKTEKKEAEHASAPAEKPVVK